ncbi:MSP7-like protein [Plasmodium sp. DRC-Itaito]|nr:MSP7-like protein [Plasmodium sp. DRC-Itaito]
MMKATIFYFFISFFVFFLHTVSSQKESNNIENYNNKDYKQLEELEKYIDNLRNTATHKFFENFKDDIQSLKKKIQKFEKKNNNNVTGQDMDDDDEEEDQNSYDENEDEYNDLDIEQNKLLQSNNKSFLGQSGANDTVQVTETSGQTDGQPGKAAAREEGNENQNSDGTQTTENGTNGKDGKPETGNPTKPNVTDVTVTKESGDETIENNKSTPHGNTGKEMAETVLQKSDDRDTDPKLSKVKYLDKLYDDVLKDLEKENDMKDSTYNSSYNNFKNKFDHFILNDHEYELLKKLILDLFKGDPDNNKTKNKFSDALKKALENETFSHAFKNVMYGLYSYAKSHSYLRGKKENEELYNMVYQNAISLLDTLMTKNFESKTNEQVTQLEKEEEKQEKETAAQNKSEHEPEVESKEDEDGDEEEEEAEESDESVSRAAAPPTTPPKENKQ